ncbi:hypothetical protein PVAP13_2KG089100 [Panicum virgatum]|uniref:Uncharacterized protein n=1 Tax=Panicum virgatum TaxID=38727 RepID=A0A8T0VZ22_PANVG|nr:hypothetical protein PVAP13_2KG089100 [Panicum virgatum]
MDACLLGVSMDADTLSSEVEIAAERRTALPHAASIGEVQKNTARMLEKVEVYIGRSQTLEAESARLREEFENERAQMDAACERTRILEERLQREFEMSQITARILERIDAYIGRGQALEAENARLREELENERADKSAAFQRTRVLKAGSRQSLRESRSRLR